MEQEQHDPKGAINYENARELYEKAPRSTTETEKNRIQRQFTITPATDFSWRDFITTWSGIAPTRGKGISSAMVELSMRLLMGVITDFKITEVANELKHVLNEAARNNVRENLQKLVKLLE